MGLVLLIEVIIIVAVVVFIIVRSVRKKEKTAEPNIRKDTTKKREEKDFYSKDFYVADDGTIVRGHKVDTGISSSTFVINDEIEQNEALSLIQESADAGIAEAQYYLGLCYEQGSVVAKDLDIAKKWYRLAASQSYPLAKFRLGKLMMENKQ